MFHANSSLRFQKVLFDINRSGCSCHNPLSAALCFDYTQLTALYSTCNGLLSPALTAKLNGFEICLYRRCMLVRTPGLWFSLVDNVPEICACFSFNKPDLALSHSKTPNN